MKNDYKNVFENAQKNLLKIYKFYIKKDLKNLEQEYLSAPQRAKSMNEVFEGFVRAL